jgi:hypothetical protein
VTTLEVERFGRPASRHEVRVLNFARERAVDELAGRTVWCATALPSGRNAAVRLQASLEWANAGGVATEWLEPAPAEPLETLARRLDAMLKGAARALPHPGPADDEIYAEGVGSGEGFAAAAVRAGDVVVVHDACTALLAEALRGQGAHVVWHVSAGPVSWQAMVEEAWTFLRRHTTAMDAYVTSTDHEAPGPERVALGMPCPDLVRERDIEANHGIGWASVLADVVEADRGEHVGGTLHARPAFAAR